ncbi:AMP-binding protein, partial [Escherichia coli]|uniref:AMP-binding protein n=1 Tax=Escherichia coli TaxID=562 RepID=UPI0013D28857
MQHEYALDAQDVVLQKTPCSFDVSVWEFFWPLMVGARLVMAPPEAHRDPQQLQQLIAQHRITTMHFVPSMLAAFVAALDDDAAVANCAALRQVFCSGEALSCELASRYQALVTAPLHN